MKEIILCKYGEIVLKGLNKKTFERILLRQLSNKVAPFGDFTVSSSQSVAYIKPDYQKKGEFADIDGAINAVKKVFGITSVVRAAVVEKDMEMIRRTAAEYLPPLLHGKQTFKVEGRRSDKSFPLTSPEISADVGGAILEATPGIRVNVTKPDVVVKIEIREDNAYIHAGEEKSAGGIPVGSSGKGLLLLSGGIDSPVAGWMMAKRGVALDAIHFESYPYTSERAREKVFELARILSEWCGNINIHVVSLTHIQEELQKSCVEDYFTLLLRRYMMRLSCRVAKRFGCDALITGESMGQVASQTMKAFAVTDSVCDKVVFRPCIGMDKEEIITTSRKIGTFDTSILPYEDCCTVFTPKHPKTQPELQKVIVQENKLDFHSLEDEAFDGMYTVKI